MEVWRGWKVRVLRHNVMEMHYEIETLADAIHLCASEKIRHDLGSACIIHRD
jgi:hypothetical protein